MIVKIKGLFSLLFITVLMTFLLMEDGSAQNRTAYTRIAKIVIDSARLESYKTALKEGMEAAVQDMVKSLGLIDVVPIALETKGKIPK